MSYYYYEDTSHYCYTVPIHHEDTSIPYDPHFYGNFPSDPVYYDELPPEPNYYNDSAPDMIHYFETPSYDELEAYAEAASNRTYTADEIHPAYRDDPFSGNYMESSNTFEPPNIGIRPVNHAHPTGSNHEDSLTSEHHWEEYTWIGREFDNGIIKYDPPTDPTFYIPSSHDNAPDDDLVQSIELIGAVLEDYREWFTREADDPDLIKEQMPQIDRLTLVSQHMEEILAQRRMDYEMGEEARKVCEDDNGNNPQPQFTPSPYDNSDVVVATTSPPDILAPIPFPPSPNIHLRPTRPKSAFLIAALKRREPRYHFAPLRRRHQPNFRNKTRSRPPDIRPPEPHPISPNIQNRGPHFCSPANRHPPFIRLPKPIPPKPNILVRQPRRPLYIRPRRKHPPVRYPTSPTPQNQHRCAIRRILKKSCPHLS